MDIPPIESPERVDLVEVRLTRATDERRARTRSRVHGVVAETHRRPGARVVACYKIREHDMMNVTVHRGCKVPAGTVRYDSADVAGDGSFELWLPPSSWVVSLETPGEDVRVVSFRLAQGATELELDFGLEPTGAIHGMVDDLEPGSWKHTYAVAFRHRDVLREAVVRRDGTFELEGLPAGTYWLRAGHEAWRMIEPRKSARSNRELEANHKEYERRAEPWVGAIRVDVEAGGDARGVRVPLNGRQRRRAVQPAALERLEVSAELTRVVVREEYAMIEFTSRDTGERLMVARDNQRHEHASGLVEVYRGQRGASGLFGVSLTERSLGLELGPGLAHWVRWPPRVDVAFTLPSSGDVTLADLRRALAVICHRRVRFRDETI